MLEFHLGSGLDGRAAAARLIGITNGMDVQVVWPMTVKEVIHPWFLEKSKALIDSQGRLVGESWDYSTEPLYAAWKMKKFGHNEVMRWQKGGPKERLYASLTDPMHPYHFFRMTPKTASIGTFVGYAERLTIGDDEGPFGEPYPGRSLMPSGGRLNKELMTLIQRNLERHLAGRGKRLGDVRSNL